MCQGLCCSAQQGWAATKLAWRCRALAALRESELSMQVAGWTVIGP